MLPPIAMLTALGIVYGLRAVLETRPGWLHRLTIVVVVMMCLFQTVYYFSFHLPLYRQQLLTVEAWQQMIFVPRQFPRGTQIQVFMPNPPDQNYLNQVINLIAGDGYVVFTHYSEELTAEFLSALPPDIPQALVVMMPDEPTRRMIVDYIPGMPAPILLHYPDVDPWFLVYLRP